MFKKDDTHGISRSKPALILSAVLYTPIQSDMIIPWKPHSCIVNVLSEMSYHYIILGTKLKL